MSDDGADLGMNADEALGVVLKGDPAPEKPVRSTKEFAAMIMGTTGPGGYEGTANWCARLIVEWLLADPTRAEGPTEDVYAEDEDGQMKWPAEVITPGWYDRMKADGIDLASLDMTGFMWGWAVNAARQIVELPSVPNPAIVTIGGDG